MRTWRGVLVLLFVAGLTVPASTQTLLDRVVARVNGTVILLSDVRAAVRFGLINAAADSEDAVEQMVQRALLVEEVNRFPPTEPTAEALDREVARLRARAGGSLDDVERSTGITVPLTDEQVMEYYRTHPEEFTSNGQPVAFERAQGLARERAGLDQRQRTIGQWLRDLRARADVTLPPQ